MPVDIAHVHKKLQWIKGLFEYCEDFNHPDLTDREKNTESFSDQVKSKFVLYQIVLIINDAAQSLMKTRLGVDKDKPKGWFRFSLQID